MSGGHPENGAYPDDDLDAESPLQDILDEIAAGEPNPAQKLSPDEVDAIFSDPDSVTELNAQLRARFSEEAAVRRAQEHYKAQRPYGDDASAL